MQANTIQVDTKRLTDELAGFTGSLERTRHWTRRLVQHGANRHPVTLEIGG